MLKKFDDLTPEQQKLVHLMYSTKETLKQFLYNFDEKEKYVGRQFTPETGVLQPAIEKVTKVVEKQAEKVIEKSKAKKKK